MLKEMIARTRVQGGMQKGNITKYQPFPPIALPDRQWPSRTITTESGIGLSSVPRTSVPRTSVAPEIA